MNSPELMIDGSADVVAGKLRAVCFSLALIGSVVWPIQENWRRKPHDNFPLSYYPMFSSKRDAVETFYYLFGRDEQGVRHYVPHKIIGVGGGNSVRRQLRRNVTEGRAAEVAHSVARRIGKRSDAPWTNVVTVVVARGKYSVDDFFHGKKDPVSEKIEASCPVKRRSE